MVRSKIKSYRQLCSMTQKEMANLLGISETQYREKENGRFEFKESEMFMFLREVRKHAPHTLAEDVFL